MTDQPKKPADQAREARLAKALRDNLRRRKAGTAPAVKARPAVPDEEP